MAVHLPGFRKTVGSGDRREQQCLSEFGWSNFTRKLKPYGIDVKTGGRKRKGPIPLKEAGL
mgnify:CR=1 FL=1